MMRRPLLVLLALAAFAAKNTLSPDERKTGWQLLFDGVSLKGWTQTKGSDAFVVEQGAIKATHDPKFREDLSTAAEFGDFDLSFDWRISPGGNSGVKYRVQEAAVVHPALFPKPIPKFEHQVDYALAHPQPRSKMPNDGRGQIYMVAFEYQVIDNTAHSDAKRSQKSWAGAMYQLVAPVKDTSRPVGEWNEGRIVVRGNRAQHWLNGAKVVDVSLDDQQIRSGLEARWTAESPVFKLLTRRPKARGPVVLQNHNDEAWFRNIKIRPLP